MEHVFKCFTYGKKVIRNPTDVGEDTSRVDTLKMRFRRIDLLRKYFAVQKDAKDKKFSFPVNEFGEELAQKRDKLYDEI